MPLPGLPSEAIPLSLTGGPAGPSQAYAADAPLYYSSNWALDGIASGGNDLPAGPSWFPYVAVGALALSLYVAIRK